MYIARIETIPQSKHHLTMFPQCLRSPMLTFATKKPQVDKKRMQLPSFVRTVLIELSVSESCEMMATSSGILGAGI